MATIDELVIELSADTKALQADMRAAVDVMAKSSKDMAASVEKFSKDGAKSASFFQSAIATMAGYVSGQAVIGAFNMLKDVLIGTIKDGIEGAAEGQTAFFAFSQALVTAGKYSEESANKFKDFADRLQIQTGITAEASLSVGKLLTSFTDLANGDLITATRAIADFSTLTGKDMDASARMFAMALNGNSEAFKKYGISVAEGTTEAQRFKNTIDAINSRALGQAAAQADTYEKSLAILKLTWGELTEEIGKGFIENKAVVGLFKDITGMFRDMAADMGGDSGGIKKAIAGMIEGMLGFGSAVIDVAMLIKPVISGIAVTFQSIADAISQYIILAKDGFSAAAKFGEESSKRLSEAWNDIGNTSALEGMQGRLELLKSNVQSASKEISSSADVTKTAFNDANTSLGAHGSLLSDIKNKAAEAQKEQSIYAVTTSELYNLQSTNLKTQLDADLVNHQFYFAEKLRLLEANIAAEQVALNKDAADRKIMGQDLINAQMALDLKSNTQRTQLKKEQTDKEKAFDEKRKADFKSTMDTISTLASSNNKTLSAIGKAAAIRQATIDGYAAVQKALASAPPPFNFVLAGAVGAATAANVAKIAGVPLATGIDEVPGSGFKDNFPAILAPGERVVPTKTNEDLTRFLESQSNQPRANINVNITMNDLFTSDPREMGLKIIETINETAQANGVRILGSSIR